MNEFLEVYMYVLIILVTYNLFTYLIYDSSREELRDVYYKFTNLPYGNVIFLVFTSIFTLIYAAILTIVAWLV
uniref:hypothetical protein n=1 Tax=Pseudomonas bubulae TaxID=2316085 RepID=UPI002B1D91BD